MERWKRLTNQLASQWGTLDLQIYERARPLYHGELHISPITNKPERRYPKYVSKKVKILIVLFSLFHLDGNEH